MKTYRTSGERTVCIKDWVKQQSAFLSKTHSQGGGSEGAVVYKATTIWDKDEKTDDVEWGARQELRVEVNDKEKQMPFVALSSKNQKNNCPLIALPL